MIRNLKALGLALAAVFAFSALSASAASATNDHFTAEKETALLTGVSHDNVFQRTASGTKFECTTSKFAATIKNGDTQATVDATYNGTKGITPHTTHCTSSAGNVTIDMNGCHYILTGSTTKLDPTADAEVWITCPEGKQIQITSSLGVTISVPAQTPTGGGVSYANIANHAGSGKTGVKVTATVTGITASCAPALACAFGGVPSHANDYEYNGTVNITGYEDKNQAGVITPASEGSKINIGVQTT